MRPLVSQGFLDEIIRRVVEVAQPDRIVLFGSAARGEMGPDSDLDLLIVKETVADRRELTDEIRRCLASIGIPKDVIVVTPEELERYRDTVGPIIRPALRDGKEIYRSPAADGAEERAKRAAQTPAAKPMRAADPAEWLRLANSNMEMAIRGREIAGMELASLCFKAQMAAETAVKAVLVKRQYDSPKTRSIGELLKYVQNSGIQVPADMYVADVLTPYAEEEWHPISREITQDEYRRAIALAESVVRWATEAVEHG